MLVRRMTSEPRCGGVLVMFVAAVFASLLVAPFQEEDSITLLAA